MGEILIPLADGLEEIEAITPVDVLRRAGIEVVTCSLKNDLEILGSHGIKMKADRSIFDVKSNELAGIILPGGMPGSRNLQESQPLLDIIRELAGKKELLAAICAAPIVLEKAGVIEGRQVTSFPGFEDELSSSIYREELIVKDGNIITGRGPGVALDFSYAVLEYLLDERAVLDLKKKMMAYS